MLELGRELGPFTPEEVPGVLRLEAAGKVLEDGAAPVGAAVTLTWATERFSKVAVVNKDVTGEGASATGALASVFAEVQGFGVLLPEPALDSMVPLAAK